MAAHSPDDPRHNPYAAPDTDLERAENRIETEMERIRSKNLAHEGMVQWVGAVFLLCGLIILAGVILSCVALLKDRFMPADEFGPGPRSRNGDEESMQWFLLLAFGMSVPIAVIFGQCLRLLQNWARIVAGILAIPGLLLFPPGTIASGIVLYILFSPKGAYVCSREYREVIAATPEMRYQTALAIKILVGLFLALIGFVLFAVGFRIFFPIPKS